jgi:hypothetical protein
MQNGISENPFLSRKICNAEERLQRGRRDPLREFAPTSTKRREEGREGICPEKLLNLNESCERFRIAEKTSGREPPKEFPARERLCRDDS